MAYQIEPSEAGSVILDDAGGIIGAVVLADGSPLPAWMSFDPVSRTLSYNAPIDFDGPLALRLDIFADTRPDAFQSYPFEIINPVGLGGASLIESVIDTYRSHHADKFVTGKVYVDPLTGSDANAGTVAAPFKTIAKALGATLPSEVVLAAGIYDELINFANSPAALNVTKLLTSTGPVVFVQKGAALSALTWTEGADGVFSATIAGTMNAIVSGTEDDSYGFDQRFDEYGSAAGLAAAAEGWRSAGNVLYVKPGVGATLADFLAEYSGLYAGFVDAKGTRLAFDGDFEFRGVGLAATPRNGVIGEIWVSGVTSFVAPVFAMGASGGWLIAEDSHFHASGADGINANPSADGTLKSLIVDVNVLVTESGDALHTNKGEPDNRQASSAHGGADHISVGSISIGAFGQGIADTGATVATGSGVASYSWVVDFEARTSRAFFDQRDGAYFQGANRVATIDGLIVDASFGTAVTAAAGSSAAYDLVNGIVAGETSGTVTATPSKAALTQVTDAAVASASAGALVRGDDGANVLIGGAAPVRFAGGLGDDSYYVSALNHRVIEAGGAGYDRVYTGISYTLADYAAIEMFTTNNHGGMAAINLTGNAIANTIYGNAGANILDGGGGADALYGAEGDDSYIVDTALDFVRERAAQGNDTVFTSVSYTLGLGQEIEALAARDASSVAALSLTGNEIANSITGNAGSNVLTGGGGVDQLFGLGGDDTYYVDGDDVVFEAIGGGFDRIYASASYVLAAGQSVEQLATTNHGGTAAINFTGNELANIIYGNAGANLIDGGGGNDTLYGELGNDTYRVNSALDYVRERTGGGTDTVLASVSYTLSGGQEIEVLATTDAAGTAALSLTGNEIANILTGNAGSNVLTGGGGADALHGLAGDDNYYVDALDSVFELAGQGYDRVYTNASHTLLAGAAIEQFATTSATGSAAIDLTGNALAQAIYGNAGSNRIAGRGGADTLIGNGGADVFVFDTAPSGVAYLFDISADDRIVIDRTVFTGFSGDAAGALAAGRFNIGTQATDADDRILFDPVTLRVFYDADGVGGAAAIHFATLRPGTMVDASSFVLIG